MDDAAIANCQEVIGYQFTNPLLLSQALTHSSVAATRVESNERMEFLGDSVLGLVICQRLYESCEDLMEGEMTKIKSTVVSRTTCAAIAEESGLAQLTILSKGMNRRNGPPQSVSAAVFESIIGAIYVDGGLEPAREFILRHVQKYIDEALENEHQKNFKSMLQQYAQRKWSAIPVYLVLDEKGPDHSKCFEIAVSISGRTYPSAWGMSKKEAEQEAARLALDALGLFAETKADPELPE